LSRPLHRRSRGCRRACPGSQPGVRRARRKEVAEWQALPYTLQTVGRDAGSRVHHQAPAPRAGRSWQSGRRGWRPAASARATAAAWWACSRWAWYARLTTDEAPPDRRLVRQLLELHEQARRVLRSSARGAGLD